MKYREEVEKNDTLKLRDIMKDLPDFCSDFLISIAQSTSSKTRLNYAYDLRIFLKYLILERPEHFEKNLRDITIEDIDKLKASDIELFLEYLTYYNTDNGGKRFNREKGKARKLASVRRFMKYLYKVEKIHANPAALVESPKLHKKPIVKLEPDETAKLLDSVESGADLTAGQKKYHDFTKYRDMAILCLLLGTGMRVSECVGLDVKDIDLNANGALITRKGGNQVIVYYGEEVARSLKEYLTSGRPKKINEKSKNALFISMQGNRMSVRSVQKLVKKYSSAVITMKNISPHKLRSTYGTALYRASGDIYLVADALGHQDVNTTKNHYVEMDDDRRRKAPDFIYLRDDEPMKADKDRSNDEGLKPDDFDKASEYFEYNKKTIEKLVEKNAAERLGE